MGSEDQSGFRPSDFGMGRLFSHVRDAVIVANAQTERIVLWNHCASELFGYTEKEALSLPLHTLVPENLRDAHRAGLARYQETGEGKLIDRSIPVELVGLHKDGTEVPIELTLTPMENPEGHGDRFALAIVRDASERKLAEDGRLRIREAELRQQQALELNDTVVQGLAVAKMALDLGDHQQGLEAVRQTLERAKELVGGLLGDFHGDSLAPGDLIRRGPATLEQQEPDTRQ